MSRTGGLYRGPSGVWAWAAALVLQGFFCVCVFWLLCCVFRLLPELAPLLVLPALEYVCLESDLGG